MESGNGPASDVGGRYFRCLRMGWNHCGRKNEIEREGVDTIGKMAPRQGCYPHGLGHGQMAYVGTYLDTVSCVLCVSTAMVTSCAWGTGDIHSPGTGYLP